MDLGVGRRWQAWSQHRDSFTQGTLLSLMLLERSLSRVAARDIGQSHLVMQCSTPHLHLV